MKYELTNKKENKTEVAQVGSTKNKFTTTSIEFDMVVTSSGLESKQSYKIPPILPMDFDEYIEDLAINIGKAMDKLVLDEKMNLLPAVIIDDKLKKIGYIKRNIRRA